MANTTISALTAATSVAGTDLIPIVQGGVTKKAAASLLIPASYTDEQVRDVIGTALVAGTNVTLTVNDAGDTITVNASGSGGSSLPSTVVNRTTAYTAAVGEFVLANATSAGFTVTLPTAPATGALVAVKKTDGTANVVTVVAAGGGLIDGDANTTITSRNFGAVLEHVGSNAWQITAVTSSGGSNGTNGTNGVGVPVGGTTGQVLAKTSNTDYATGWTTVAGATDATTGAKGIVQLAGDLGGTAASPTVPGLANKLDTSAAPELIRDTMGTALVAGANVTLTVNDAGDTITVASSGGGTTDVEVVRDTIAAALVAGTNVTITPNDGADTITIAATGGGSSLSVQDENGTAITGVTQLDFQGAGVTATAGTGEVVVTIPGGGASTVAPTFSTTATWRAPFGQVSAVFLTVGTLVLAPVLIPRALTLTALAADVTTAAAAGGTITVCLFNDSGSFAPSTLLASTAALSAEIGGAVAGTVTSTSVPAGLYWYGVLPLTAAPACQGANSNNLVPYTWSVMPLGTGASPSITQGNDGLTYVQTGLSAVPTTFAGTAATDRNNPKAPLWLALKVNA